MAKIWKISLLPHKYSHIFHSCHIYNRVITHFSHVYNPHYKAQRIVYFRTFLTKKFAYFRTFVYFRTRNQILLLWQEHLGENYTTGFLNRSKIYPIEEKSSGYNTHASLDAFCEKYSNIINKRYLIYTKDFKKDKETILLPVYMTPFI